MNDDIFDPTIHASDPKTGEPKVNRDGSFRKKRRDAGTGAKTSRAKSTGDGPRRRYEEGVRGLLQIPAAAISFVNPVDGFTIGHHTPTISTAVADLAVERPEVAAALDKILTVGPYGALIGAILPLAVQLAHNHNIVPEAMATAMGATPKREIERHLRLVSEPPAEKSEEMNDHVAAAA